MNEPNSNADPAVAAPAPAAPSLFGSPAQYVRSAQEPMADHEASVTGATTDDPARHKTRLQPDEDVEWANPLSSLKVVAKNYAASFWTYWGTYGVTLLAAVLLVSLLSGDMNFQLVESLPSLVILAPVYGLYMDYAMVLSMSWYSVIGVACFIAEFVLGIFFLLAHEWPLRLRYCALTVGFVLFKCLIYVLGHFIG